MNWNYRILKRQNESGEYEYGIHEVFYNEKGEIVSWTKESMTPVCPSKEGLRHELNLMLEAFRDETIIYKEE